MENNIRDVLGKVAGNVKLIVKGAGEENFLLAKEIDTVFSSASLIKVPILFAVLNYIEKEHKSLNQIMNISPENRVDFSVLSELQTEQCSLYELSVWMIIASDNTATNELIDFIGIEKMNEYFSYIGLTQTSIQRKMMDFVQMEKGFDNVTTARDMALLFTKIYRQELVTKKYSQLAIDILSRQRDHEALKRFIADDVTIAHKTGSLETVEHDVGIIYSAKQDYIIGVFITNLYNNNNEAKKTIGKVSKIIYEHLGKA